MEKARESLESLITEQHAETLSEINTITQNPRQNSLSFYEEFGLNGIRVDRIESGTVFCTFKVPPRLTDAMGNMYSGAIANIIDAVGGAAVHANGLPAGSAAVYVNGLPVNVSVDMSISYLSTAKVNDELEIIAKALGRIGGYSGTIVVMRNKATGELIAEGRHSLFGTLSSKI